ncbi:MAG: GNAT family N-acetyltransferase [Bacteroidetes bacterium]|jgi:RimJ/RimL family protein N-acetyltransferase|nr:GNAT family N-acetyltransferase [Bacteroidota bacterium]
MATAKMKKIGLRMATKKDKSWVVALDYALDQDEHIELSREEKITKAILDEECFIVLADNKEVGFIIFDYRFFDQGWIELIIIDEDQRGKGIGGQALELICQQCKTDKVFTSTNKSNTPMQRALAKAGFSFSGELNGLDDGDPELFYFKRGKAEKASN